MPADLERVREIVKQYCDRSFIWGGDFLLPPSDAVSALGDLAEAGVLIIGCDLWRYFDSRRDSVIELVGAGGVVNDRLTEDDARRNADMMREFLSTEWPDDADLVSFVFRDDEVHALFANCQRA